MMHHNPVNWSKSLMACVLVKEISGAAKASAVMNRPLLSRASPIEKATIFRMEYRRKKGPGVTLHCPEIRAEAVVMNSDAGEMEGRKGMKQGAVQLEETMYPMNHGLPQSWPCWMIAMSAHASCAQL